MRLRATRFALLVWLPLAMSGVVEAQDFSISVSPSNQTIWQAWSVSSLVTITPTGGFSDSVGFSTSGLPSGATANFSPSTVSGSGTSTMTITASPGTPTGSYSVTVTGTSGTLMHNASVTLTVAVPPPISYSYDAVGRLTSVTDQLGNSAIYSSRLMPEAESDRFLPA